MKYFTEEELGFKMLSFYESRYGLDTEISSLLDPKDVKKLQSIYWWGDEELFIHEECGNAPGNIDGEAFVFKFICQENWIDYFNYLYEQAKLNEFEMGEFVPPKYRHLFTPEELEINDKILARKNSLGFFQLILME